MAHTQSRPSHMEDWVIYIYTVVYNIHEAVRAGHPAYSSLIRNNQFKCLFYCVKLGLLLPPVLHIHSHKLWWHPDCLQWAGGLHWISSGRPSEWTPKAPIWPVYIYNGHTAVSGGCLKECQHYEKLIISYLLFTYLKMGRWDVEMTRPKNHSIRISFPPK